ncbi:MAG: chromate transporter [Synergistaceae bacterium]|nr:chromate transporter [Synergistaceae bacterium]
MQGNLSLFADLFLTFAKIGLFTFGGGYAMISMIETYCVESKRWITHDEMMSVTVIAESTPGPIAINCATYVGHKKAGFAGAVIATLGIVFPSFIVILIVSEFLAGFMNIPVIAQAFSGVKIAAGLLIIKAAVNMFVKMRRNNIQSAIILSSLALSLSVNASPALLMIISAIAGIFLFGGKK